MPKQPALIGKWAVSMEDFRIGRVAGRQDILPPKSSFGGTFWVGIGLDGQPWKARELRPLADADQEILNRLRP